MFDGFAYDAVCVQCHDDGYSFRVDCDAIDVCLISREQSMQVFCVFVQVLHGFARCYDFCVEQPDLIVVAGHGFTSFDFECDFVRCFAESQCFWHLAIIFASYDNMHVLACLHRFVTRVRIYGL